MARQGLKRKGRKGSAGAKTGAEARKDKEKILAGKGKVSKGKKAVVLPIVKAGKQKVDKTPDRVTIREAFTDKDAKPGQTGNKFVDLISSPKTTAVLAGTLAAVSGVGLATGAIGGGAAATGGTATITKTIESLGKVGRSATAQRAFVGRPAATGVTKLFAKSSLNAPVAARFATNPKSIGLTTSLIKKIGGTPTLLAIIGSYPFAGFIREEALQTLGFAAKTATQNGDIEGLQNAIIKQEEILNPTVWDKLINKIPFANVVKQLKDFFNAARVKLENDKQTLANLVGDVPTPFEVSRQEARQTQLEQRGRDAEYFNLIREGKFEEAQELLDRELAGGNE